MPVLGSSSSSQAYGFKVPEADVIKNGAQVHLDAYNQKSLSKNYYPNPTDLYAYHAGVYGVSGGGPHVITGLNNGTWGRASLASPVGNTPIYANISGGDPHWSTYAAAVYNITPILAGETWTVSCWMKSTINTTAQIFIFGAAANGTWSGADITANTFAIGTEWTRVWATYTFTNADTRWLQLRFDCGPDAYPGSTYTVWIDGAQAERSSAPTGFDPRPNNIWYDISNNNRNSPISGKAGINNVTGKNRTVAFDGTDDRAIGTVSGITGNGARTISAWFRGTVNDRVPFSLGDSSSVGTAFSIVPQSNNTINVYGLTGPYDSTGFSTGGVNVLNNSWHNVVASWDGVNTLRVYTNGSLTATQTVSRTYLTDDGYVVGNWGNVDRYWTGEIAQTVAYNRALSDAEVAYNFNITRRRFGV
jgi:hypothetical protein